MLDGIAARFGRLGLLDEAAPGLGAMGWTGGIGTAGATSTEALLAAHPRDLSAAERHAGGVHYTPAGVARGLARVVLDPHGWHATVADPACGTGVFLLAAAERLRGAGGRVEQIVRHQLFGADLDATAIGVCRLLVTLWAAEHTDRFLRVPEDHVVVADGLGHRAWPGRDGWVDAVVGNPPFGSQLRGDTVYTDEDRARLASRLGLRTVGYADTASLFLLRAVAMTRRRGTVGMILPASVAASSGAGAIRAEVARGAELTDVWIGGSDVGFDAAVHVWAPVFRVGTKCGATVNRHAGPDVARLDEVAVPPPGATWARLLSDTAEREVVHGAGGARGHGARIDEVAAVTAGFRQHFYGLAPHVVDDPGGRTRWPVLVTTGAIDPLHHRSGSPVRFAGRHWRRPVVDLDALRRADGELARWVTDLLRPKVLVASQGRVVEVIVDDRGVLVPSVPVIAVVPLGDDPDVWHLAAGLSAPSVAAGLQRDAAGTGLGTGTCRVTARFVAAVRLPEPGPTWDDAARAARRAGSAARRGDAVDWEAHLDHMARSLTADSDEPGTPDAVFRWWRERRPRWRGARTLDR